MKTFPLPDQEAARLDALLSCQILDTPTQKEFDELAELVAQIANCPMATISFLDRDRQWAKAAFGMPAPEVPRSMSFCTYTIMQQDVMIVEDATTDIRFADNPAVTGPFHLRFYAGAPIVSSDGHNLGTVCVYDMEPRNITDTQKRALEIVSGQVTKLIELHVRNLMIREQARQRIDMEKKTLQHTLRQQEEERQSIGNELHENFGQVLAACSLYLNMAEELQQNGRTFLSKARTELARLTDDVRRLSRQVSPISLHHIDFRDTLQESIQNIRLRSSLKTELVVEGSASHLSSSQAVTLLRVIIQYLEVMGQKKEVSSVSIELLIGEQAHLSIRYRASHVPEFSLVERVDINALLNRVESEEGSVKFTEDGLEVVLSQAQHQVA